jgi:hypothetical protein
MQALAIASSAIGPAGRTGILRKVIGRILCVLPVLRCVLPVLRLPAWWEAAPVPDRMVTDR